MADVLIPLTDTLAEVHEGRSTPPVAPNDVIVKDVQNNNANTSGSDVFGAQQIKPQNLSIRNLSYTVPGSGFFRRDFGVFTPTLGRVGGPDKVILNELSGQFKAGQLHAIMGPSGAGKSSLMNILAGAKTRHITGEVNLNGQTRVLSSFRKLSSYIMQEESLLPTLNVKEQMMCAANLKLPESVSGRSKHQLMMDILEALSLKEAIHTRTESLSGGQKKRLSIALELINNPPVMFFDEPTSGLDSASCYQCVVLLKLLAAGGRTIICTIHQPSAKIFEIFDQLYMVAGGNCIYTGPVRYLVPYLAKFQLHCPPYHNPSDYMMEVAVGDYGERNDTLAKAVRNGRCAEIVRDFDMQPTLRTIATQTRNGSGGYVIDTPVQSLWSLHKGDSETQSQHDLNAETTPDDGDSRVTYKSERTDFATTSFTQFKILFFRTFISILRNKTLTLLRFTSHLVTALILGCMYWDVGNNAEHGFNNIASIFFHLLFLTFGSMMPTVLTFPSELNVFVREHLNYWYSLKAYYLAKTLADIPFQLVLPIAYILIVYYMTGQPQDTFRFFEFLGFVILTTLIAQSVGLLIGAIFEPEVAVFIAPVCVVPLLLFSGFFITFDAMHSVFRAISYVSYVRYAFSGSMLSLFAYDRPNLHCDLPMPKQTSCPTLNNCAAFLNPADILDRFDITPETSVPINVIALAVIFVITRLSCYLALRWKIHSTK